MNNKNFADYLDLLRKIISFETVLDNNQKEKYPFGKELYDCLEYVLNQSKKLGFNVFNRNGYYGYAETKTNKKETLVIAGHLDVVPANKDGWKTLSPFSLEQIKDTLYGRGVVDDKGPIIAQLFIVKELLDEGYIPKRNIRIVFGCNEETGCECMKKYSECEKDPDLAFTPDADFPCIYAEKAIIQMQVEIKNISGIENIYGGQASNIVLDKLFVKENNKESVYLGKAAHASTPELGENAFIKFLETRKDDYSKNLLLKLKDFNGKGLKIYKECDLTGKLTLNIGIVKKVNDSIILNLDLRVPKDNDLEKIKDTILKELDAKLISFNKTEHLFVDPSSELVQKLVDSYNKVTRRNEKAIYSGGGTYAKHIKNCVAFGPQFDYSNCSIHENNENIKIEDLKLMYEIYKEAIKNLAF